MTFLRVTHLCLFILLVSCGGGSKSSNPGYTYGPIDEELHRTSAEMQIPYRLLLGVALKESHLSPRPSTSLYSTDNLLGISVGETAFGLSFEALGLPKVPENMELIPQIRAYGAWLRQALDEKNLSLTRDINGADELYDWVWQMALLHRDGKSGRKNVQILFALEMIHILNQGATWQDQESGEIITLAKEAYPIDVDSAFSLPIQKNLRLDTQKSEIFSVDYMQLTYEQGSDIPNIPAHIRVIHCPFSLSACLDIQHRSNDKEEARLQAHYVIPRDSSVVSNPLKIQQHKNPVLLTDFLGRTQLIQDAVVIMLVGDSGHYVDGVRLRSDPRWYTDFQLQNLSKIVPGVCDLIKQENPAIDSATCRTPGVNGGIQFQNQGPSESYRWGDIPDYDKNIFWTYIIDQDQLSGKANFKFSNDGEIFSSGSNINFNLKFIRGASKVSIEYMERCENQKVIWTTLQTHFVRDTSEISVNTALYSQGPNQNGQHFLRALVYDVDGSLMAWEVKELFLRDYDQDNIIFADLESCD